MTLRRHAEAALWEQQVDPQTIIGFFATEPPLSGKGYFALARAWLVKGDSARAYAAVRTAWRNTGFSEELEAQARAKFSGLITPADDKARMDARLYVEDDDAAMRAAQHLDAANVAIAKARAAVNNKAGNAKALLERRCRRKRSTIPATCSAASSGCAATDKIREAAQWMLAAPHDPNELIDLDQWWIERRLIARKLLDLGDAATAYEIANGAAPPSNENYRAEQQFTAGWIALRIPARARHRAAAFRPHRRRRRQSDHAGALVLLAGPRRPGAGA